MRKSLMFVPMLFLSVITVMMMTVTSASASRAIYTTHVQSHDSVDIVSGAGKYTATATVYWNWGWYAGDDPRGTKAWARPTEAYITINSPGSIEPCGILDGYNGADFTFAFSNPDTGYYYQGTSHHLKCAKDTTNGVWVEFSSNVHRMHYTDRDHILIPRWKCDVQIELDIFTDPHGKMGGLFRRP